ncbi:hypothetical protein D3C75_851600 [compost metagenome]
MAEFLRTQEERFLAAQRVGGALAAQRQQGDGGQRDQAAHEAGDEPVITIAFIDNETGGQDGHATEGDGEEDRHGKDVRRHEHQRDVQQRRCDIQVEQRVGNEDHAADRNGGQPGDRV